MTKSKTLEQLRTEKERAETQLAQEQHKLERLENRKKYLEKGERTKRTHRLCNLGGTVESLAPEIKDLTRTEMTELMEYIFSLSEVQRAIRHTGIWPTLSQRSYGNSSILLFCKPMRQSWNRWRSAALWGVRPLATNSKPEKRLPNRQRQGGLRRKSPAAVQSVDLGPCWHEAERRREPCHANGRAMTRPAITTENCWAAVPKRTATLIPC